MFRLPSWSSFEVMLQGFRTYVQIGIVLQVVRTAVTDVDRLRMERP